MSNQNLKSNIIQHVPAIVFRADKTNPWQRHHVSEGIELITGYSYDFLMNEHKNINWMDLVHAEDFDKLSLFFNSLESKFYEIEYRIIDKKGHVVWVLEKGQTVEKDCKWYIDGIIINISNRLSYEDANMEIQALYEQMAATEETLRYNYDALREIQKRLEEEKLRYQLILKASQESFWDYDPKTKRFEVATLLVDKESLDTVEDFLAKVHPDDLNLLLWFHESELHKLPEVIEVKVRLSLKGTHYRWHNVLGVVTTDSRGVPNRVFGSISDIHDAIIQKERIEFYAYHDATTGLYTVDYMLDMISKDIGKSSENDKHVMLVVGAINYYRMMTVYGRDLTEILLFQLGAAIKNVLGNVETISKLTRGRYLVWLKSNSDMTGIEECVEKIEKEVEKFMYHEMLDASFGFGYGAVCFSKNQYSNLEVLKCAEIAFEYAEKAHRVGHVFWFNEDMQNHFERSNRMEQLMKKAIQNEEFYLVFQPQYTNYSKAFVYGYEVLLRWENPELGLVPPNEFIPLAEETGYIHEVGKHVIEKACCFLSAFEKAHGEKLEIAINVSFKELVREDYAYYLYHMVKSYNVLPAQIKIEVTETAISQYVQDVVEQLKHLSRYGFEIHMDDFGTGYSSLNLLGTLPVNVLKIDQSFVAKLNTDQKMRDLTALIIEIGHRYHMKIIAEGVETFDQYLLLEEMQCDYYQGYGLSFPITEEVLLKEKKSSKA